MFFDVPITGEHLPAGTLCLTYDDGPGRTAGDETRPGPRTAELAAYLQSQGVAATFFAVGKFAAQAGEILAHLRACGHLVANHTFDHPSLPGFAAGGGDPVRELARTDEAIRPYVDGPLTFFRAPYGDWTLRGQARSDVAAALNRTPLAARYVGPVGWDIDGIDVGFWRDGRSAEECAEAYLEAIEQAGRGIVLMHDSTADVAEIRARNQALGVAERLVPELLSRGYRFVRLDQIAGVVAAARVDVQWSIAAHDGFYLTAPATETRLLFTPPPEPATAAAPQALFGAVHLAPGRFALRAAGGLFVTPRADGRVAVRAVAPGPRETLFVEPQSDGRVALRTVDGLYLSRDRDDTLRAAAVHALSDTEMFHIWEEVRTPAVWRGKLHAADVSPPSRVSTSPVT